MSKVLELDLINSENKDTTLLLPNTKDGLDEAVVHQAVKSVNDVRAFNKGGVGPYHSAHMAKYVETTTATLFDDTKSNQD